MLKRANHLNARKSLYLRKMLSATAKPKFKYHKVCCFDYNFTAETNKIQDSLISNQNFSKVHTSHELPMRQISALQTRSLSGLTITLNLIVNADNEGCRCGNGDGDWKRTELWAAGMWPLMLCLWGVITGVLPIGYDDHCSVHMKWWPLFCSYDVMTAVLSMRCDGRCSIYRSISIFILDLHPK